MNGLLGVHHVALIASDYGVSKQFYIDVLGMEVVSEIYREDRSSHKLNLRFPDGIEVELFSFPDPPPRVSRPEAAGLRHLALRVSSLEPCLEHLRRYGVAYEPIRVDDLTGCRFVFFSDPDGLPLELYETPA